MQIRFKNLLKNEAGKYHEKSSNIIQKCSQNASRKFPYFLETTPGATQKRKDPPQATCGAWALIVRCLDPTPDAAPDTPGHPRTLSPTPPGQNPTLPWTPPDAAPDTLADPGEVIKGKAKSNSFLIVFYTKNHPK